MKERNYTRRWIIIVACENRRRYKGSKMTSCCAMMTQRNDPWRLLYLSSNSEFIRDGYFENDVGQISAKWRTPSKTQIGVRCIYFNVIFERWFTPCASDDYSYDPLIILTRPYSYDNERCEILDVRYHWPMRRATRPCAASLNLRVSKSLRRNWNAMKTLPWPRYNPINSSRRMRFVNATETLPYKANLKQVSLFRKVSSFLGHLKMAT